jgi:hypothetical protein
MGFRLGGIGRWFEGWIDGTGVVREVARAMGMFRILGIWPYDMDDSGEQLCHNCTFAAVKDAVCGHF